MIPTVKRLAGLAMAGLLAATSAVVATQPVARAASAPVPIPMPFDGRIGNTAGTYPTGHPIYIRDADWSADVYGAGGTPLSLQGLDPRATVTIDYAKTGKCGDQILLSVSLDGYVGKIYFTHLVLAPGVNGTRRGTPLSPATASFGRLATLAEAQQWRGYGFTRNSCYQVRTEAGVHTHMEAIGLDNGSNFACFVDVGIGANVAAGTKIGELGPTGVSGLRQACPTRTPPPGTGDGLKMTVGSNHSVSDVDIYCPPPSTPGGTMYVTGTSTGGTGALPYFSGSTENKVPIYVLGPPGDYTVTIACQETTADGTQLTPLGSRHEAFTVVDMSDVVYQPLQPEYAQGTSLTIGHGDPCPPTEEPQAAFVLIYSDDLPSALNSYQIPVDPGGGWYTTVTLNLEPGEYVVEAACSSAVGTAYYTFPELPYSLRTPLSVSSD